MYTVKRISISMLILFITVVHPLWAETASEDAYDKELEDIVSSLDIQKGNITLGDGVAQVSLGNQFRFLAEKDADIFLSKIWGNPPGFGGWGLIIPANTPLLSQDLWAIVVYYDEDGYVSDKEAEKINYDKLLKTLTKETEEDSK
ncbi:MAG: DUF2167 domain-containing protein, partial [Candidatus Margulisbacteria bacterium]|nr:DUF2167 domain-containing protein [Candidatus Margulisiibacteriota bacterium]